MFDSNLLRSIGKQILFHDRKRITLTDDRCFWIVVSGEANLFYGRKEENKDVELDGHVSRFGPGDFLFSMPLDVEVSPPIFIVTATSETELLQISWKHLYNSSSLWREHLETGLQKWIHALAHTFIQHPYPSQTVDITKLPLQEESPLAEEGKDLTSKNSLIWIKPKEGVLFFVGDERFTTEGETWIPINTLTWLHTWKTTTLEARSTANLVDEIDHTHLHNEPEHHKSLDNLPIWRSLQQFHRWISIYCQELLQQRTKAENLRLQQRVTINQQGIQESLQKMASVLDTSEQEELASPIDHDALMICKQIGKALHHHIQVPSSMQKGNIPANPLQEILKASRLRTREVILEHNWWKGDHGPFIGFDANEGHLLALIPVRPGKYEKIDPTKRENIVVDAVNVQSIQEKALSIYRPLPARSLKLVDLITHSASSIWKVDAIYMFLFALAFGALSLFIPYTTGLLFDTVIPEAESQMLVHLFLILLVTSFVQFAFQLVQGFAMLRMEGKAETAIQSAVWDRLLSLPASFFRNYLAGDLAERALSISKMRQIITQISMVGILSLMTIFFNGSLMLIYDVTLALYGFAVIGLVGLSLTILAYFQIRYSRKQLSIKGRISGLLLQVFQGITKFKASVAEHKAFQLWVKPFVEQRFNSIQIRRIQNFVEVIMTVLPLFVSMILFYLVMSKSLMTPGLFLGFNAAFTAVLMAIVSMSSMLMQVLEVFPMLERARPILETTPEVDEEKEDPGQLKGALEVSHVSFRYQKDAPMLLQDIHFQVKAGEYVAIVGTSGSGKSTLLRLLLGFEEPESGAIFYDDRDLQHVDVREVRQQLGVVLQNSRLMTGSIFDNIVGASNKSMEDAWEAARLAGLEKDIKEMPMQMHTLVSEGGGSFSGGQRQRLLIARALIKRPRIIYFDEATSALDNQTQKIVIESLESLRATRIVIAHRLSTIINADKILVLEKGRIVENGTYEELVGKRGLFSKMVERQLA